MGYITAYSTIEYLKGDLTRAISLHFQSNCYPPVSSDLLESAVQAVEALVEEDYDRPIQLPEWTGRDTAPAGEIVDAFHLEAFIDYIITTQQEESDDE